MAHAAGEHASWNDLDRCGAGGRNVRLSMIRVSKAAGDPLNPFDQKCADARLDLDSSN